MLVTLDAPVPREAVIFLRVRLQPAALADPALRTFAAERNVALEAGSAGEVEAIVRKTLATPKAVAEKAKAVLDSMKTAR